MEGNHVIWLSLHYIYSKILDDLSNGAPFCLARSPTLTLLASPEKPVRRSGL